MPDRPAPDPTPLDDLRAALDGELSRLSDAYRTVIILCDLEERTRREAAAVLGWPEGTVAGRLVRARELLARRMARHAPAVSVAAVLSGTAAARVPEVLAASAAVPPGVAALTREVVGAMVRGKLMKTATAILLLACAGFGMALHAGQTPGSAPPVADGGGKPVNPQTADDVAWGETVDGLQVGLTGVAWTYRHGETMKMGVKLRNVGKVETEFTYVVLNEYAPAVAGADGRPVHVSMPPAKFYKARLTRRVVKPGETVDLYNPEVAVSERLLGQVGPEPTIEPPTVRVGPGKYTIAFGRMITSHPALTTGTAGFEVKDAKPAEPFTAWGKEVGGMQAGLEVKEKRTYRLGETVTLVVRIRNVSKEPVKFEYVRQYLDENPPAVTGTDGKPLPQARTSVTGLVHPAVGVTLEPGKEVVLETRIHGASGQPYELRPADGGGQAATKNHPLRVGTGKVTLWYEKVFGNSSIGRIKIDPDLAELPTGKLELEVTDAPPKGALSVPTNNGFRELKGKERESYETANAWLEERLKEAQSIKVGSTYYYSVRLFTSLRSSHNLAGWTHGSFQNCGGS